MSTDHQKYAAESQSDAIRQYAEAHGIEIVRPYADAGKSGLKIERRDALRQLIEDVQNGNADFTVVPVYDVSRGGRFQDADESAYYEYLCRRAGISVQYCAEQFENDGSPVSMIVKGTRSRRPPSNVSNTIHTTSCEHTSQTSWQPTTSRAGSRSSVVSRLTNASARSGHQSLTDSS